MKILAKWSIEDYHRTIEAGILCDRKVELLAGEIIEMSPEKPIHYNTTRQDVKYLEELLKNLAEVRFNGAITLADSEPEPDIAIVRLPASQYSIHHPYPEDIFWVIEVANPIRRCCPTDSKKSQTFGASPLNNRAYSPIPKN